MGRIAGKAIAVSSQPAPLPPLRPKPEPIARREFENGACLACHDLSTDVARQRSGFWHYEQSHRKVLDRGYACAQCHSDLYPYEARRHRQDLLSQTENCASCHGPQGR